MKFTVHSPACWLDTPGMHAVFQQHHLLGTIGQKPEPGHETAVTAITDKIGQRHAPAQSQYMRPAAEDHFQLEP